MRPSGSNSRLGMSLPYEGILKEAASVKNGEEAT